MESQLPDKYKRLTYSYLALRRAVGWIGILLPFVLLLGNKLIFGGSTGQPSISLYYHTPMRDVLVGGLCAVALFLFFYSGYDRWDNITANLAGFFALLIAFFPASETGPAGFSDYIHFPAAGLFLSCLAVFSLFLFTKDDGDPTPRKVIRNRIYMACGAIMTASLISLLLYLIFKRADHMSTPFIFWAETVALVAFGVSWLTKGGTLYPDKEDL
ncbi:MAG: hypothetical protein K0B05_05870 [Bacteroidales bacterium]|nr:hypothetical protein [Bacteroidales bacterium]